jgi:hypothetical protein
MLKILILSFQIFTNKLAVMELATSSNSDEVFQGIKKLKNEYTVTGLLQN